MNLETHKIIDIIDSRDPKIIQAYLNQFSNLELISRDRGHQYSVLCPSLIHVADRFHLIMNLTTIIINYVRNQMKLTIDASTTDIPNIELNTGQKTKQLLVNDVRTDYAKCKNMALVAQKYNLSWITVRKYLSPNFDVVSKRRTTGDTKITPYINEIDIYYKSGKMCTEIYQMIIKKYGFTPFAYRTLCDYIKKTYKKEAIKLRKSKQMNKPNFIKYLFNWHPDLQQEFFLKKYFQVI